MHLWSLFCRGSLFIGSIIFEAHLVDSLAKKEVMTDRLVDRHLPFLSCYCSWKSKHYFVTEDEDFHQYHQNSQESDCNHSNCDSNIIKKHLYQNIKDYKKVNNDTCLCFIFIISSSCSLVIPSISFGSSSSRISKSKIVKMKSIFFINKQ